MINLYCEAKRKQLLAQAGFELAPLGYLSRRSTNWVIEPNGERRADSTNLSEIRLVVNNLTLEISIGEDSTVFRLDLNHPQGNT